MLPFSKLELLCGHKMGSSGRLECERVLTVVAVVSSNMPRISTAGWWNVRGLIKYILRWPL